MLKVDLLIDKKLQILKELVVQGHALFDKKGRDIACASVSSLVYSSLLSFKKLNGLLLNDEDRDGKMKITLLEFDKRVQGELRGITLMLVNGLLLVKERFQENIKIDIKENIIF